MTFIDQGTRPTLSFPLLNHHHHTKCYRTGLVLNSLPKIKMMLVEQLGKNDFMNSTARTIQYCVRMMLNQAQAAFSGEKLEEHYLE